MGVALYVSLEGDAASASAVDGKALASAVDALNAIAKGLGVAPLSDFYSENPDDVADLVDGLDAAQLPAEEWFAAADGLRTVDALLTHLRSTRLSLARLDFVIGDLDDVAAVLSGAAERGIRFHFSFDI